MEEARKALGGAVLILDEASMVGTVQMRALTRLAAETGVERLALIGDRRQLRAVEVGQPFTLLARRRDAHGQDGRGGAPARCRLRRRPAGGG